MEVLIYCEFLIENKIIIENIGNLSEWMLFEWKINHIVYYKDGNFFQSLYLTVKFFMVLSIIKSFINITHMLWIPRSWISICGYSFLIGIQLMQRCQEDVLFL